jgi:NTE family protein
MKLGLVLAGGGGRGAYQVGAWRALREAGLDTQVQAVAGTSIGALHAALFMQGDLEVAEEVWARISPALALDAGELAWLPPERLQQLPFPVRNGLALLGRKSGTARTGLLNLMRRHLRYDQIAGAPIPGWATVVPHFPLGQARHLPLNGADQDRLERILLASSAVPLVFDPVEIDGERYSDGGAGARPDRAPVRPVYEAGCDRIIVVHLDRLSRVNPAQFPGAAILQLFPSRSLGLFFTGLLDFNPERARWRIDLGYREMRELLAKHERLLAG